MGRSVSRHKYSLAVAYDDISRHGYAPEFDPDTGDEINGDDPESWPYCEAQEQYDWEDWLGYLQEKVENLFPSMEPCYNWLGDEDFSIMENAHAYIGVSEYCGLASIWLVCKGDVQDVDNYGLSMAWCNQITPKFEKSFGDLVKLGSMSNGAGVYKKRSAGQ